MYQWQSRAEGAMFIEGFQGLNEVFGHNRGAMYTNERISSPSVKNYSWVSRP